MKSKEPLYQIVYKKMKEDFESGVYDKNQQIPKEMDLCEKYDVSRLTIRRALDELYREGLIKRVKGKGTFFTGMKNEEYLTKLSSFSKDAIKKGYTVSNKVLENSLVKIPEFLVDKFKLPNNSKVVKLKRIRYIDNEPYAIETAYLNPGADIRILNIIDENMEKRSLYEILLKEYELDFDYAEEQLEITTLSQDQSRILSQKQNSPGALRIQHTYLKDSSCIEYVNAIYRADKYKFKVVKRF